CSDNGGSSSDIGADATRGLGLFQIPDGGLVGRFLLPPAEPDAAGAAGRRAARQAASAIGFAGAAVEPDYITHAGLTDLLGDPRLRQQSTHRLGLAGRGARLEPGEHLVDEIVVVVNRDGVASIVEIRTDAIHEIVFCSGAFDLRFGEDDDEFALGDWGGYLAGFLDARLHAAAEESDSEAHGGHAECVHGPAPRPRCGMSMGAASMPRCS